MNGRTMMLLFVLAIIPVAGCTSFHLEARTNPDEGREESARRDVLPEKLNIPPGHYPPPGECRIWYPNRPAGQQPPPGNCSKLKDNLPQNAWLIRRMSANKDVRVTRYHPEQPGVSVEVNLYDPETGELKVEVK